MNSEIKRCSWCGDDPVYVDYHDREWGRKTCDDRTLFEFLILEGAQAGLSWITILRKREAYRAAFSGFDPEKVAAFGEKDIERLLADPGIIRNRLKIRSAINNAKLFLDTSKEYGSFYNYIAGFFPSGVPVVNHWESQDVIPCRNEVSDRIAADMNKRGFTFFGSVICYSFLQATGFIDDHIASCHCHTNNRKR